VKAEARQGPICILQQGLQLLCGEQKGREPEQARDLQRLKTVQTEDANTVLSPPGASHRICNELNLRSELKEEVKEDPADWLSRKG
jgi:hypothetical protein